MVQSESLLDRPKFYYNIDGVGELGVGFMCLGFVVLQWFQMHAPENSVWLKPYAFLIFGWGVCLIIHFGSKAIKKHLTYPRTGFVQYRKRDTVWRPMILGAAVSGLLSAGLVLAVRRHWELTTPAALIGLLLAASYAYGFARAVRWKWAVAGAMAFGSVVIAVLPPHLIEAPARHATAPFPARVLGAYWLSMLLFGALSAISGSISFWLYLRYTQPPSQSAQ